MENEIWMNITTEFRFGQSDFILHVSQYAGQNRVLIFPLFSSRQEDIDQLKTEFVNYCPDSELSIQYNEIEVFMSKEQLVTWILAYI